MPGKKANNSIYPTVSKKKGTCKSATITIINSCFAGLEITLKKARTSLGRDLNCDICLDHTFVSNRHAVIQKSNGDFILEDLNSRHGTTLNGKKIHHKKLKNGDRISVGNFELKFSC